ncbi:hypothetical protein CCR75_000710 [Bremia lactucae]|uniref:Vacuolar protein sorting-associated protein 51 homolog n=1 Tax=Bremia lactucae TaxID=4779 RepID=A0A976FFR2_BRELC|nr:hypothetical protein CCR75_000710 [Bremia lactucae]
MNNDHGMNRMQELLSSYYGLEDQESQQEQQRNIDSPGFDSNVYVKELLKTRGLNDLLSIDDQLIQEIKELDTNMQMLVYDNYSTFINATDTIHKVKNNVASMEDDVGRVVKSMETITAKSESINVALVPHRSKVEKLLGVQRLLKKFEFIFDLPERLTTAVKQKEYANATNYYLLARRILERYEHISSFKTIQFEAEKGIQQLERILKEQLLDMTLTSEELCETIVLLHQLNACSDENRIQFLEWHQVYFKQKVATFKTQETPVSVFDFLQQFHADILSAMSRVFAVYTTHFKPEIVAREMNDAVQDTEFFKFVNDLFALYATECTVQFRRPFSDFGAINDNFSIFSETDVSPDILESEFFVLMCVMKDFVSHVYALDKSMPMCGFAARATNIVKHCIHFQIQGVFHDLQRKVIELLVTSYNNVTILRQNTRDQGLSIRPLAYDSTRTFIDNVQQVLERLKPMMEAGFTMLPAISPLFTDLLQREVSNLLKWFNTTVLQSTEPKRTCLEVPCPIQADHDNVQLPYFEPCPHYFLFLACMCQELARNGIANCLHDCMKWLPPLVSSIHNSIDNPPMHQLNAKHVIQLTRDSSNALIQHVARYYGHEMCEICFNSIAAISWPHPPSEPQHVQEKMLGIVETTMRFGTEIANILGDTQSVSRFNNVRSNDWDVRNRTSALRSWNAEVTASSGMPLNVDRIFARRIQIVPSELALSTDTIVLTMLKVCLKGFIENLRLVELSMFGLQQMQLNAAFLCRLLLPMVTPGDAEEEIKSLLFALLLTARTRAFEDVLMDESTVVAIVNATSIQLRSRLQSC